MKNEQPQRRLIAAALFSTESTTMLPSPYEQLIAHQYITGSLSIQQAMGLLEEHNRGQVANFLRAPGKVHVAR